MFFRILIKYILGYINIKIEGYFVEKFINKCINENIYEIIITDYPAIVSTIIDMLATIITACIFLSPIVIILIIKNKKKNKQS